MTRELDGAARAGREQRPASPTTARRAHAEAAGRRVVAGVCGAWSRARSRGESSPTNPIMQRVSPVGGPRRQGTINVLIVGENGVGKEILRRLHRQLGARGQAVLCINCASFSEQLFESELFGHERGAFTAPARQARAVRDGARRHGLSRRDRRDAGVTAVKLLRVLETRLVTRVGGLKARPHRRPLRRRHEPEPRGRGRGWPLSPRSLLSAQRHNVAHPAAARPARERSAAGVDLPAPVLPATEAPAAEIDADALRLLTEHPWAGNRARARNMMERATLLCARRSDSPEHLMLETVAAARRALAHRLDRARTTRPPIDDGAGGVDRRAPHAADERARRGRHDAERDRSCARWPVRRNQSRAAKALGMARSTLVLRLNNYRIPRPPNRPAPEIGTTDVRRLSTSVECWLAVGRNELKSCDLGGGIAVALSSSGRTRK